MCITRIKIRTFIFELWQIVGIIIFELQAKLITFLLPNISFFLNAFGARIVWKSTLETTSWLWVNFPGSLSKKNFPVQQKRALHFPLFSHSSLWWFEEVVFLFSYFFLYISAKPEIDGKRDFSDSNGCKGYSCWTRTKNNSLRWRGIFLARD